jgi:uncharacterized protein (TIGR04255 family)
MPTYSRNFLTRVICRVDFPTILVLRSDEPAAFQEAIREPTYPRFSVRRGIQVEVVEGSPTARQAEPTAYVFEDEAEQNKVTLTSDFLAYETTAYVDFNHFFGQLSPVFDAFVGTYGPSIIERVGLRYVNEIRLPNGSPFDWEGLINADLTRALHAFPGEQSSISRSMHQMRLNKEDYHLNVAFGVYNSEFPNTITQKEFVLDYDCFSRDERSPGEVEETLRAFNAEIESLFEASIGDRLREIMMEGE